MAEGSVKNSRTFIVVGPSDRLGRKARDGSKQQRFRARLQRSVSIKGAVGNKIGDTAKDRMIFGFGNNADGSFEFVAAMVLVISAEDLTVPFFPIFKSMAGR